MIDLLLNAAMDDYEALLDEQAPLTRLVPSLRKSTGSHLSHKYISKRPDGKGGYVYTYRRDDGSTYTTGEKPQRAVKQWLDTIRGARTRLKQQMASHPEGGTKEQKARLERLAKEEAHAKEHKAAGRTHAPDLVHGAPEKPKGPKHHIDAAQDVDTLTSIYEYASKHGDKQAMQDVRDVLEIKLRRHKMHSNDKPQSAQPHEVAAWREHMHANVMTRAEHFKAATLYKQAGGTGTWKFMPDAVVAGNAADEPDKASPIQRAMRAHGKFDGDRDKAMRHLGGDHEALAAYDEWHSSQQKPKTASEHTADAVKEARDLIATAKRPHAEAAKKAAEMLARLHKQDPSTGRDRVIAQKEAEYKAHLSVLNHGRLPSTERHAAQLIEQYLRNDIKKGMHR